MRKTSVRELHINTSELVREASEGGVIIIESRGKPVAELRPITVHSSMPENARNEIFISMRDLWDRMPQVTDSTTLIEEDRDR